MEISSALLALCAGNSPVTGEFRSQRPVTQSFDVFFDLRLNKLLSKQSWSWWLGHHRAHYDVIVMVWCLLTYKNWSTLVHIMAWRLFAARLLPRPMRINCESEPRNIFRWNFIWNSKVFIQENSTDNIVSKMSAILSRPQSVFVYPLRGTQLGTEIWRLTSWIGGW